MDSIAARISEYARTPVGRRVSRYPRWVRLTGASALATLVGLASYAAAYHLLSLLSAPAAAVIGPLMSGVGVHTGLAPG